MLRMLPGFRQRVLPAWEIFSAKGDLERGKRGASNKLSNLFSTAFRTKQEGLEL
jgi:hypothetical protein